MRVTYTPALITQLPHSLALITLTLQRQQKQKQKHTAEKLGTVPPRKEFVPQIESDLRSNEHYLSSRENQAYKIQVCTGLEPTTPATPAQRSTNRANRVYLEPT